MRSRANSRERPTDYAGNMNDRTVLWLIVGVGALLALAGGAAVIISADWFKAAGDYLPLLQAAEAKYGLPTGLLTRVAWQESRFRPDIIDGSTASTAGALGIMQLMPQFYPGVDPLDPAAAIDAAAQSLKAYYQQFGSWSLAVAAYNAGPGNVKKFGNTVPPFPETQSYVADVIGDLNAAGVVVA